MTIYEKLKKELSQRQSENISGLIPGIAGTYVRAVQQDCIVLYLKTHKNNKIKLNEVK